MKITLGSEFKEKKIDVSLGVIQADVFVENSSAELLGLQCIEGQWQFIETSRQQKWQIRHSEFIDDGQAHPAIRRNVLHLYKYV